MRTIPLFCTLVLALATAGAGEPGRDLDRLQGTWAVTAAERNGRTVPEEELEGDTVYFKKAEMTVVRKGMVRNVYKVKLDAAKDPRHIDLVGVTGLDEGKTLRGIYRLEGDRLTLCAGLEDRPTEYKTRPGSTLRLTTLKRKQP